jgi:fatty aldehyde-generating acyl-ACP reductase
MEKFAFVIHPINVKKDIARKFPIAAYFPTPFVEFVVRHMPPFKVSHITGIKTPSGVEIEGYFIGCPLTPNQLLNLPAEQVYPTLIACGKKAEELGAKIIGLGALTSVVGDGGITVAKSLNIAVTTGNAYTVATAVEGAKKALGMMGVPLEIAQVAVVGAAGSIGRTCALLLAPEVASVTLVGRTLEKLEPVLEEVKALNANTRITADVADGLREADLIVTVTSAADAVILPEHLKPGAVVCDVARPRDVSTRVAKERDDVLIIEGGVVAIPGPEMDFHFNFGFPPQTGYACMSETMLLTLEKDYENVTLGKTVSVEQASYQNALAQKHGFKLAGFRSFEKAVTDETIDAVRKAAARRK